MILIATWSAEEHVIISAAENAGIAMKSNAELFVKKNAGLVLMKIRIIMRVIPVKVNVQDVTSAWITNAIRSQLVLNALPAIMKPINVLIPAIPARNVGALGGQTVKKNVKNVICAKQLIPKGNV